jgi:ubiquinone/menaquinone biosynthesis C-methylase UbiE
MQVIQGAAMTDYLSVYRSQASRYDLLIEREDYLANLLPALQGLVSLEGLDVVELGAGTGRLTRMLAPKAASILAFDRAPHMLSTARGHLEAGQEGIWYLSVCDHRHIPAASASADLAISGWSIAYLVEEGGEGWREEVDRALAEMERILRSDGTILLLETLGTGFEAPRSPDHLVDYFSHLEGLGFQRKWLRTDYRFSSLQEAVDLAGFFFGPELADRVRENQWVILPECTGIWSRTRR